MSTILDALKRSEQERKLNNVPTLSDMPTPQERSRLPLILLVVLIILVIALISMYVGSRLSRGQDQAAGVVNLNPVVTPPQAAQGQAVSNEIVVNVISYSEEVGQSFAMINGKMYREKEFIRAGLKVDSISVDKVVINQRGKKITLRP